MLMITLKITVTRSIALKWWNLKWDLANSPSFVTNRRQFSSSSEGRICKRSFFLFIYFFFGFLKSPHWLDFGAQVSSKQCRGFNLEIPSYSSRRKRSIVHWIQELIIQPWTREKHKILYRVDVSSVYIILGWLIWLKIIFPISGLKNIILPTWGKICLSSVTNFS